VAGFGLMLKFFKVVEFTETSSRPLEVQGMAKYQIVFWFRLSSKKPVAASDDWSVEEV